MAGAVAGAIVAVLELAGLGAARASLVLSVLGVCVGAGAVIGGMLAAALAAASAVERLLAARAPAIVRAVAGALVVAAPALLILVPVGRTLFQGAYAATLPGAGVAPVAVPVGGWLAIAAASLVGARWRGDARASCR
jgi:hypothetical protein